jgi:hypothetical protein
MDDRKRLIEQWMERFKGDPKSFFCAEKHAWMTRDRCLAIRKQVEPDITCWKCNRWDERRKLRQKKNVPITRTMGRAPFGYMRCGAKNLVNPDEIGALMALVSAVESRQDDETMQDVANRLNQGGYRRRGGTEFDAMSVRNLYQTWKKKQKD